MNRWWLIGMLWLFEMIVVQNFAWSFGPHFSIPRTVVSAGTVAVCVLLTKVLVERKSFGGEVK